ncbi:hypothetical protein ACE1TF_10105 [Geomicrobium sp. JSM 1781026]|uniref:hypothetical protein n=1 Tax=unclassified Geomicrobium TaxID=2628951 RepID=UPI00045F4411|nr:hypothetical protein [Geomicrobium sp. JCM 19039]GAK13285.1 hypothetical protein JCM19039_3120 [Geomicrobium sp. JCM 19039]
MSVIASYVLRVVIHKSELRVKIKNVQTDDEVNVQTIEEMVPYLQEEVKRLGRGDG